MTAVKTWSGTVIGTRVRSPHLMTITLQVGPDFPGTGVPDEAVTLQLSAAGQAVPRVYTVSDLRPVGAGQHLDLDVVLHGRGPGTDWARRCRPRDRVQLSQPHGSYAAPPGVAWQLVAADLAGLPALARILRGLRAGQQARAVVVVTDRADRIELPSAADVEVDWIVVDAPDAASAALRDAVLAGLERAGEDRYVWVAGEARATRAVRRHLRRELGWPQTDLSTLGYWQADAEQWNARYAQVASQVRAEADRAYREAGADQGAFLDALEDIYDRAGL